MRRLTATALLVLLFTSGFGQAASAAGIHQLNYVALGDSLAFGLFAPIGRGYVPLYSNYLRADLSLPVTLYPLGVPGWTTSDLLAVLRGSIFYRFLIFSAEVVTFNIGSNDLNAARSSYKARTCGGADNQDCLRNGVIAFKSNWENIVVEILRLRRLRPTIVRTMDIYNPFVNVDKASDTWPADAGNDFTVLKPYLEDVNAFIAANSTAHHIAYAQVYRAFNGADGETDPASLLSFDRFHPNGDGHAKIAQLLRGLGYLPIVP